MPRPKVKYNGPSRRVSVPREGLRDVPQGKPVSVPPATAERLLRSPSWSVVKPKPRKRGGEE